MDVYIYIMKLNKTILDAIKEAVKELGSQVELAEKCKFPKEYINQYLSGKTKGITLENWLKLEPNIRKYLPKDFSNINYGNQGIAGRDLNQGEAGGAPDGKSTKTISNFILSICKQDNVPANAKIQIITNYLESLK